MDVEVFIATGERGLACPSPPYLTFALRRRRAAAPRPTSPVATSASEAGSGVIVIAWNSEIA
jgi:hypothetical protein